MRSAVPTLKKFTDLISKRQQWLPIGLILILSTLLCLYQLGTEGVWIDEIYSLEDAADPSFAAIGTRPLYYLLLRLWMVFGSSDAWLRGLAVVFGVASVFLTYLLGRRLAGESTARIGALLMALSPLMINHSQEIRMYTLSTALTLGGSLALTIALQRPSYAALAGWSVSRLLAILTTPLNFILLLPDCLLWGWKFRDRWRWLLAYGTGLLFIGAAWSPIVLTKLFSAAESFSAQHGSWEEDSEGSGLTSVISKLTSFTVYWPLQDLSSQPIALLYYKLFTVLLLGLLGFVLWRGRDREDIIWLTVWAFLPAACLFVLSQSLLPGSAWRARYLLFAAPYLLLLLAEGFVWIWRWQRGIAVVIALAYSLAVGGGLVHYYTTLYRENWHGVEQAIDAREQPGDVVVQFSSLVDYSLARYYNGSSPFYTVDKPRGIETTDESIIQNALGDLSDPASRLWLVCWLSACKDQQGIDTVARTVVGESFKVESHEIFKPESSTTSWPIEVFLITPNAAE